MNFNEVQVLFTGKTFLLINRYLVIKKTYLKALLQANAADFYCSFVLIFGISYINNDRFHRLHCLAAISLTS